MNIVQSFSTPVNYLIDIDNLRLVEGAKDQLRTLTLADIILLTDGFNKSKNLNQIGEVKLKLIKNKIEKTDEYNTVKDLI